MSADAPPLGAAAEALLAEEASRSLFELEVFEKRGRSRRFERQGERESASHAVEEGWAVRAGDRTRSIFFAATGAPDVPGAWPDPTPHPLLLPSPQEVERWEEPEELALPLATEAEAWRFLDGLAGGVVRARPAARLLAARLEEGSSESVLLSSRGVRARIRSRAAALRCELQEGARRVVLEVADRALQKLDGEALAERLAARLRALATDAAGRANPAEMILAAPLAARLVEALAPWFGGRSAAARWAGLANGAGRIAAETVTLLDDGRIPGGLLAAPTDGEGMPCRRVELVAQGRFVGPLLAWWEGQPSSGCARRASYRDLPRRAPTHCWIAPGAVPRSALVESVASGVLLLDAEGGVRLDPATASFSVPVSGFEIADGRIEGPLGPRILAGSLGELLRGIAVVGSELDFVPGDGLFGAPPLLVRGLTLAPGG